MRMAPLESAGVMDTNDREASIAYRNEDSAAVRPYSIMVRIVLAVGPLSSSPY